MYLEEIIEYLQLESDKFECKAKLNMDDIVGWLKTIASFANASGGDFYIGVEDSRVPIHTFVPVADGIDYDDKVLSFCYYQAHKFFGIAEYMGISDSTF